MDEAALIAARLLREGVLPRGEVPGLRLPEVRQAVVERLRQIGIGLAESPFSDHVGIRLLDETAASHSSFEPSSNLGLGSDALALVAVLWMRLVLHKRIRDERGEASGERGEKVAVAGLREEALFRDYGALIGARTRVKALLTQLKRLKFIRIRSGVIEAGPLLELAVDGSRMAEFVDSELLPRVQPIEDTPSEIPLSQRILERVDRFPDGVGIGILEQALNTPRAELLTEMRQMREEGLVDLQGVGRNARWVLRGDRRV